MSFQSTVKEVRSALQAVGLHTECRIRPADLSEEDCWGFWQQEVGVVVHHKLRGIALWRVLLHEVGHEFGLDHRKRGLMKRKTLSRWLCFDEPTPSQKKRWTMELARLVLRHRGKKWRVK